MSENSFVYPGKTASDLPFWPRMRHTLREPFAEFLGTMILILFGDGVVAQVVLSDGAKGSFQSINWSWGIGVMFGVYAAGGISGGHLNPAVTLANCILRGFPWKKFPLYVLGQMLGAFVAAFIVYGNYKSAIDNFEGHGIRTVHGATATAGIFCTYPQPFLTKTGQFFSEVVGSAVLMMGIYAINDTNNLPAGNLGPLVLVFLIFGVGASFGWQTGYAINPARDFAPRLASYILGYGTDVWKAGNYYFWVPIVAPCIGCTFGGFLYDIFVFTGAESPINAPVFGLTRIARSKNADTEAEYVHNPKDLPGTVHGHADHEIINTDNVLPVAVRQQEKGNSQQHLEHV